MPELSGWVQIDHPLLERLRAGAQHSRVARIWLLESARRWAQGEFARRSRQWDRSDLWEELERLKRRQVAVLTEHANLAELERYSRRIKREWKTHVGLLHPETDPNYLKLDTGRGSFMAGIFDIVDIIELPEEFQIEGWMPTAEPYGSS